MRQQPVNILLAVNEAFAQHAAVCIRSLQLNNPKLNTKIIIASLELKQVTKARLLELSIEGFCEIELVDFNPEKLDLFPQIGVYTKDIYLRLWVAEFFQHSDSDKVLYLDADTIVVGDISGLFNIDMEDNIIAAVDIPDSTSHSRCHLPTKFGYFNSGVLLFNLKLWKTNDFLKEIAEFLEVNKDIALNPDQDALNGLYYNKRITLDYEYNAISTFFRKKGFPSISPEQLLKIQDNVKIVHFNGRARPWLYGCNHPYQSKYIEYLEKTPWHSNEIKADSFIEVVKKRLRSILGIETFVQIRNLNGI